jgi:hypothetical protein
MSFSDARRTFGGIHVAANAVAARLAEYFNIRRRVIRWEPARIESPECCLSILNHFSFAPAVARAALVSWPRPQ